MTFPLLDCTAKTISLKFYNTKYILGLLSLEAKNRLIFIHPLLPHLSTITSPGPIDLPKHFLSSVVLINVVLQCSNLTNVVPNQSTAGNYTYRQSLRVDKTGRRLLSLEAVFATTTSEIASALILGPRGTLQLAGKLVHETALGMSRNPCSFQCSIV